MGYHWHTALVHLAKKSAEKKVGSMQGWEEVDGRALQVCAACNLAWLDTSFQLAPEAGPESGNSCIPKDHLTGNQAFLCCSSWEVLSVWASGGIVRY